jgi:fido (protein-threonine AMPylation protein)
MLKHDPTICEEKVWEDFKEKGLCPEIKNLNDYRTVFDRNIAPTERIISKLSTPIVDPSHIKTLHGSMFKNIHPWAGSFRGHNLPCRGRDGASPENIQIELEMLQTQVGILMEETSTKTALYRIAAFQHARLTTIQAFGDGNTRTSRAVTENFLNTYTGKVRIKEMEKPEYLEALEAALGQENLAPLAGLFRKIYGDSPEKAKWAPAPFQTTNQIDTASFPGSLKKTIRQRPDILEDEIIGKANFLVRWPWEKVTGVVGGKPTPNYHLCQNIWEEARFNEQSLPELTELIRRIEKKKPLKGSLFGEKPCWNSLRLRIIPTGAEMDNKPSGITR